jgi:hypothetical protein
MVVLVVVLVLLLLLFLVLMRVLMPFPTLYFRQEVSLDLLPLPKWMC